MKLFNVAVLLIFLLCYTNASADNVITGGANVRINSGVFVTMVQQVVIENGSTLSNEGTLILKNNLTNQNLVTDLGKGTIEFSGTSVQNISGQNTMGKLVVNNPQGLNLLGNTTINKELGLLNGMIRLGANNLILGNKATLSGTSSASAMVIATGTGELRKYFSQPGTFTFPVGDLDGKPDYTPVNIIFLSGDFSNESFVGIHLKNETYNGLLENTIRRYWHITQNGISNYTYDAAFQYTKDDINGDDNGTLCIKQSDPLSYLSYNLTNSNQYQLTANGAKAFGVFSGLSMAKQTIILNAGWNIFSSNLKPLNLNIKDNFQSMINNGVLKKIMDESGNTLESFYTLGGWQNKIGNFNTNKGYKINVNISHEISFIGIPVKLPMDINLTTGWNIISFPTTTIQDAKSLVQILIDEGKLNKVMDEAGHTIENLYEYGGWQNNIGNFIPGNGYKINVTENCILNIPSNNLKSMILETKLIASDHFKPIFIGNGTDHMNVHLVNIAYSDLITGDEIGVFDGSNCVGSINVDSEKIAKGIISIACSSDDELNETVDGFISGHPVSLKLYREGKIYRINYSTIRGNETFEKNESVIAQINSEELTDNTLNNEQVDFRCYPNPFTHEINFEIDNKSSHLNIEIYNLTGQRIINFYSGINNGNVRITWDGINETGQKVTPGVYICKINNQLRKLIYKL